MIINDIVKSISIKVTTFTPMEFTIMYSIVQYLISHGEKEKTTVV